MVDPHAMSPFPSYLDGMMIGDVCVNDLSGHPRIGFKGRGARAWLSAQSLDLPERPNLAILQKDGEVVAWLGGEEFLVLCVRSRRHDLCATLSSNWEATRAAGERAIGFPIPWADSHGWLRFTGNGIPELLATLCGVDLRPDTFAPGVVAQTIAARVGVVLIRADTDGSYVLHFLADRAFGPYLAQVLADAKLGIEDALV